VLETVDDPFGPLNAAEIFQTAVLASLVDIPVVCAWGVNGNLRGADKRCLDIMEDVDDYVQRICLGRNKDGSPKHPLYVSGRQKFEPFSNVHI
jgi:hypothetical protein